jgi:RNA polymerase sigma-70 factor, ECF subfamily
MGARDLTAARSGPPGDSEQHVRLALLRRGDEHAFASMVRDHSGWMLRTAMVHVDSRAVAEEVVQEAWMGALRGLERFEGRSSIRTWLFSIVVAAARKRAERERRTIPYADVGAARELAAADPIPARFFDSDHPRWAGCWTSVVRDWSRPEQRLLPPVQRTVFVLRDMEGWSSAEVCDALALTPANQRVLLHRARLRVREALEHYLDGALDATRDAAALRAPRGHLSVLPRLPGADARGHAPDR